MHSMWNSPRGNSKPQLKWKVAVFILYGNISIPNFFTPNEDGFNDFWEIGGIEAFPDCVISIFDRSGRLLSQYKGIVKGWDGTFGSLPMPENDYWYVVDLKNGELPKRGHFTLKRQ